MIEINKSELSDGLDLLMNVPQLKDLNTNKEFKEIFSTLVEDVYINETEEIKEHFRNNPSNKIVQTVFLNYGILPEYYEKLNPIIKRKLIYYLEILFQQKGSIDNLKIISELFNDFFKDINYYGISVNKLPYKLNGVAIPPGELDPLDEANVRRKYILSYFLKPIIISKPELLKFFPNFKIDLTGKYLMKLEQFERFDIFPLDTNLLYIDFIDSGYLQHSDKYFINGAMAFTMTKYQKKILDFSNDTFLKMVDNIYFKDIDIILQYFNLRFMRYTQTGRKQLDSTNTETLMDIDFDLASPISTSLIYDKSMLDTIELLLLEYKNVEGRPPKIIKDLSRRWQFLLQSNYNDNKLFKEFKELDNYINTKYPTLKVLFDSFENKPGYYSGIQTENLLPEEIIEVSKTDYINFIMNLYINVLNNVTDGNEFVELSINAMFQNILNSSIFINYFFTPVFKLFVNYFMSGNMDYIVASGAKVIIKDKFESVFVESKYNLKLFSCFMDSRYLPCNKIDINIYSKYEKAIEKLRSEYGITIFKNKSDTIAFKEFVSLFINTNTTESYNYSNRNRDNSNTNLILNKQNTDNITNIDNYIFTKNTYNFFNELGTISYIKNYIWKMERTLAITKQIDITKETDGHFGNSDITTVEDYIYLKKEMYLNINNYLFYKNN